MKTIILPGAGQAPVLLALLLVALLSGCGKKKFSPAEVDQAKKAVTTCLDTWKENKLATLATAAEPITFTEELTASYSLTEYTIVDANPEDKEVIRVRVKLSLKDRKGKATEREVVFAVALKKPVVVARDPYF